MSFNTPSYPIHFPLDLHTLPLRSLDQACMPTSGADEFIQEEGIATYTHTRLINGSSETLTK